VVAPKSAAHCCSVVAVRVMPRKKWGRLAEFSYWLRDFLGSAAAAAASVAAIVLGVIVLGFFAPRVFPESPWAYRVHHYLIASEGSLLCSLVGSDEFLCDPRPSGLYVFSIETVTKSHDCEFWSAPLGRKHCHYEKHVSEPVGPTFRTAEFFLSTGEQADYLIRVWWNRVED
jgi:hypothetical protein